MEYYFVLTEIKILNIIINNTRSIATDAICVRILYGTGIIFGST